MPNTNYFKLLNEQLIVATELSKQKNAKGFLGQEILRFNTIAETLLANTTPANGGFALDKTASIDERYITHPLIRSLLENYFKILYIFQDMESYSGQFEEVLNGFKKDYLKLMNDLEQESWKLFMEKHRDSLQPAQSDWRNLPRNRNVNDMLVVLTNNAGDSLQYLYCAYRITSFDVHGNNLSALFSETFGQPCNFPVIDVKYAINLMASEYIELLNRFK